MAKQSAVGSSLFVGAYDLSGFIGQVSSAEAVRDAIDVPDISQAAMARIPGMRSGSLAFTSYWTGAAAGEAHLVLSAQPRTAQYATVAIGSTVGSAACSIVGGQTRYAPTRGQDGSLVAETAFSSTGSPLEWGELLTTGKQTFASGTVNGASIDLGATSTLFGAAAYLHVISVASGTPTVTIADSADNGTFATLSPTPLAFTATPAGAQRLQTGATATIRRYVRVQVTGTYTNLVCVVNFVRYTESPA